MHDALNYTVNRLAHVEGTLLAALTKIKKLEEADKSPSVVPDTHSDERLASLESSVGNAAARLTSLEEANRSHGVDTRSNERLASLESSVIDTAAKLTSLEEACTKFERQIDFLTMSNVKLDEKLTSLNTKLDKLTSKLDDMQRILVTE